MTRQVLIPTSLTQEKPEDLVEDDHEAKTAEAVRKKREPRAREDLEVKLEEKPTDLVEKNHDARTVVASKKKCEPKTRESVKEKLEADRKSMEAFDRGKQENLKAVVMNHDN